MFTVFYTFLVSIVIVAIFFIYLEPDHFEIAKQNIEDY